MANPTFNYAGRSKAKILSDKFSLIKVANETWPFTNAAMTFESQQVFIREAASLNIKAFGDTDVIQRHLTHGYSVEAKLPILQTTWAELQNWYKLSQGYVQMAATMSGSTFNFVDNAGGQDPVGGTAPATGSCLLSLNPTYTVDDQKAIIDLDLKGELWDGEYEWLVDPANTATVATVTGSTGSLGLTVTTDNRANNLKGGIVSVSWNGNNMGIRKKGTKFELKGISSAADHKGRELVNYYDFTATVVCRQLKGDLAAAWYAGTVDFPLIFTLANGNTIKLDSGAYGMISDITVDEKDSFVSYTFGGRCSKNTSDATPDSLDIGVTLATQLEILKLY